jgi:hypothetical protein
MPYCLLSRHWFEMSFSPRGLWFDILCFLCCLTWTWWVAKKWCLHFPSLPRDKIQGYWSWTWLAPPMTSKLKAHRVVSRNYLLSYPYFLYSCYGVSIYPQYSNNGSYYLIPTRRNFPRHPQDLLRWCPRRQCEGQCYLHNRVSSSCGVFDDTIW